MNTEQAFDMLPFVVDVYDKLAIDEYKKEIAGKYKGKQVDSIDIGIEIFKYILKNSGKIKDEVFNIVAIAESKSVDEIKKQSFAKTVLSVKAIFSDSDLTSFFKQAMQ